MMKALLGNERPYDIIKQSLLSPYCNKLTSNTTLTNLKSIDVWTSIMSSASLLKTKGNALLTPCEDGREEKQKKLVKIQSKLFKKSPKIKAYLQLLGKLAKISYIE
jgi:hypothetical protein